MRQKNIKWALALVIVVAIVVISVFALTRQSGTAKNHQHDHNNETQEQKHDMKSSDLTPSGTIVEGKRVIEVKARQFEFEPEKIVVKEGESVKLEVTSEDVTHGFKIEEYDIDRELKPNETEIINFTADKPGSFVFRCSVYCGAGHGEMKGKLVVLSKD